MMTKSNQSKTTDSSTTNRLLTCGIIAPIAEIDNCSAQHWLEVKNIFIEAVASIETPKFDTAKLVSDSDSVAVIHKSIVQNLYNADIVICDMSCKNPNVMFELGLRLAFNKPAVLVIDDKTNYSFDTGIISHIAYPRDLHYQSIIKFKQDLANAVVSTYKATKDGTAVSFLSNFEQISAASLPTKQGTADEVILDRLDQIQREVAMLKPSQQIVSSTLQNPFLISRTLRSGARIMNTQEIFSIANKIAKTKISPEQDRDAFLSLLSEETGLSKDDPLLATAMSIVLR